MIVAFTTLLYGSDYLAWVLDSVRSYVDKVVVLYSPTPSEGYNGTSLVCPDDRETLYNIAVNSAGDKLDWRGASVKTWQAVAELYPQADMILELDSDEIIHQDLIDYLMMAYTRNLLTKKHYRLPFVHYWRSFKYVCSDVGWPVRLTLPKATNDEVGFIDAERGHIHHFGYAKTLPMMQYKMATSAHRGEWRPEWWKQTFLAYPERLTDLHPVIRDFWNAQIVHPGSLPRSLRYHPYYGLDKIE